MIAIYAEMFVGCSVGFELVTNEDIFEDEPAYYLSIDLFVFRILFQWMKGIS